MKVSSSTARCATAEFFAPVGILGVEWQPVFVVEGRPVNVFHGRLVEQEVLDQIGRQKRRSSRIECLEDELGIHRVLKVDDRDLKMPLDDVVKSFDRGLQVVLTKQPLANRHVEELVGLGDSAVKDLHVAGVSRVKVFRCARFNDRPKSHLVDVHRPDLELTVSVLVAEVRVHRQSASAVGEELRERLSAHGIISAETL